MARKDAAVGQSLQHQGWTSPSCQSMRSGAGGVDHRPETTRSARRNIDSLHGRIRSNAFGRDESERRWLCPGTRPQSLGFFIVDGGRRNQRRDNLRCDGRIWFSRRRESGFRPRPSRHYAAPSRLQSRSSSPTATQAATSA